MHIVHLKSAYDLCYDRRKFKTGCDESMIRYIPGVNVLELLKLSGYSTYRLARENIFGSSTVQKFRTGKLPSWHELDVLCGLLNCRICDLIEYIPDDKAP